MTPPVLPHPVVRPRGDILSSRPPSGPPPRAAGVKVKRRLALTRASPVAEGRAPLVPS